ncbi:SDR family NAD(P)-dependent oxidoreductase [Myxacorys almedinensis]|uniref:SDR family NAD(P)-dependent oxidoreductase n=1 Tax=Myxacorys almedinensis A TaxID=2690445 RepID=A0A8J7Z4B0_9CYAN|nr:SDR family oxidoreductase [Myxacorys almedinensis]NDJ16198.1 SDR family NAD(P)-dependent oxidoreductase [Myxacorys almedinensis A]
MASTVLITGASQGIGRETALLFARHGYNVVLAARNAERLEALAQELATFEHAAIAVPTDVRDPEQVNQLVERAIAAYGSVDVLVNNAGIYTSGPTEQYSLDDWHLILDTNLWGYIHTIHALLPHFIRQGSGMIVNLSSIGGRVPTPYLVPYATSKFAVTGLTKSLESELAPKGITVCGIYPSLIKSNFMERALFQGTDEEDKQARRQQLEQVLAMPVIEKPTDVAEAIWDAVQHKRTEVLVGSAKLSLFSNRLFPGLLQRVMQKTFKNKDKAAAS